MIDRDDWRHSICYRQAQRYLLEVDYRHKYADQLNSRRRYIDCRVRAEFKPATSNLLEVTRAKFYGTVTTILPTCALDSR